VLGDRGRGEYEGVPYFAMGYVEGIALDRVVRGFEGRDPAGLHGRDLFESICAGTPRAGAETGSAPPPFFDRPWVEVVFRLNPPLLTDASGAASLNVNLTQPPLNAGPGQATPLSRWYFQFWYRDPQAGGSFFNLSNGLEAVFCPGG